MSEYGDDATAEQVRQVLARAGYTEYAHALPGWQAGFSLAEGTGVTVSLHQEAAPLARRLMFADYARVLIGAGVHVDYRGHYLHVHGKPKGLAG